jgi:hypothetical protein
LAVQKYTGTMYRDLNRSLRDTGKPSNPRQQKVHDDLQAAFKKTPVLKTPVALIRGLTLDAAGTAAFVGGIQASLAAGTPITFNSYSSTSTNSTLNPRFRNNVILHIDAIHGLDARPVSHCPQANEMILPHDAEFDVKNVYQDSSGNWHVNLGQKAPKQAGTPAPKPASWWSYLTGGMFGGATAVAPHTPPPTAPVPFPNDFTSTKAVQGYLSGAKNYTIYNNDPQYGGAEDKLLNEILKEGGRDLKPQVVSESTMDNMEKQGWTTYYRAVSDPKYLQQFKTGDLFGGTGMYGNGTYMQGMTMYGRYDPTNALDHVVSSYGGNVRSNTIRIAVPPSAKIVKLNDLIIEQSKAKQELDKDFRNGVIKDAAAYQKLKDVIEDYGRFAALKNYDVIEASSSGYTVLVNRSIVAVQDTPP